MGRAKEPRGKTPGEMVGAAPFLGREISPLAMQATSAGKRVTTPLGESNSPSKWLDLRHQLVDVEATEHKMKQPLGQAG